MLRADIFASSEREKIDNILTTILTKIDNILTTYDILRKRLKSCK